MPKAKPSSSSYITQQFVAYCKRHLGNPTPPFRLYLDFLEHAKQTKNYGWMTLAKEHRFDLLKAALRLENSIYGPSVMNRVIKQDEDRRGQQCG